MDLGYLAWAFRRSLIVTLLYVIACLVGWLLVGDGSGWGALAVSSLTWIMFFSVYVNDPRIEEAHYIETRGHEEERDSPR